MHGGRCVINPGKFLGLKPWFGYLNLLSICISGYIDNTSTIFPVSRFYVYDSNRTKLSKLNSGAMSSDEAYNSFLEQANQDTGASKASTKSDSTTAKAVDTEVPAALYKVEQYYTSDADEPFEPVSLNWSGKNLPSAGANASVNLTVIMPAVQLIRC